MNIERLIDQARPVILADGAIYGAGTPRDWSQPYQHCAYPNHVADWQNIAERMAWGLI